MQPAIIVNVVDHLADGRRCGDRNAVGVLGLAVGGFINLAVLLGPFVHWLVAVFLHFGERGIQLGYVPELPLHFDNHVTGRATYGVDSHGGEQEGQHRAHEKAGHHVGVGNVDVLDAGHAHVGGKQCQRGEGRGADRESFADGGGAAEIYAWGLRNPFAFHFDMASGDLWVGDVGQYAWEEIDRVELGGNYGWNIKEGTHCYATSPCDSPDLIDPIIEYPNPGGASVVAGPVYSGDAVPSLKGSVLYSDFYTGVLWAIEWDPVTAEPTPVSLTHQVGKYFSGFAQDPMGEVYVLSYYDGIIFRVEEGVGAPSETIPTYLSETGCVDPDDATVPAEGLVPYGVNLPFWSDGADKSRWMAVPDGEVVTVAPDGQLDFPVGSVLVKQFSMDDQRLETRLMVRHEDGGWAGYSYAWDAGGTFATYDRGGASIELDDRHWTVPSSAQCMQCHTEVSGQTLSVELGQLDGQFTYPNGRTRDQLDTLTHIGMFDSDPGPAAAVFPRIDDEGASIESRARAVLHTNCAGCHQVDGTGGSDMDLRFSTPAESMGVCNVEPTASGLGVEGAQLVAPGEPDRSMIVVRMATRGLGQMPPIGTEEVDTAGLAVVREWIEGMSECP